MKYTPDSMRMTRQGRRMCRDRISWTSLMLLGTDMDVMSS